MQLTEFWMTLSELNSDMPFRISGRVDCVFFRQPSLIVFINSANVLKISLWKSGWDTANQAQGFPKWGKKSSGHTEENKENEEGGGFHDPTLLFLYEDWQRCNSESILRFYIWTSHDQNKISIKHVSNMGNIVSLCFLQNELFENCTSRWQNHFISPRLLLIRRINDQITLVLGNLSCSPLFWLLLCY